MIFHQGLSESPRNIPLRSISISTPASGDSLRGIWAPRSLSTWESKHQKRELYYTNDELYQWILHWSSIYLSLFIIHYSLWYWYIYIYLLHTSMMIVLIAFWLVSNYNKCWIYGYTVSPVEWVFKHSTYSWRCVPLEIPWAQGIFGDPIPPYQ